jgi:hypothetical protein
MYILSQLKVLYRNHPPLNHHQNHIEGKINYVLHIEALHHNLDSQSLALLVV